MMKLNVCKAPHVVTYAETETGLHVSQDGRHTKPESLQHDDCNRVNRTCSLSILVLMTPHNDAVCKLSCMCLSFIPC